MRALVKLPVGVVSAPPLRRPGRHLLSADSGWQVTWHVFLNLDNSLRYCWKTLLVGRTFSSAGQLRGLGDAVGGAYLLQLRGLSSPFSGPPAESEVTGWAPAVCRARCLRAQVTESRLHWGNLAMILTCRRSDG